MKSDFRSIQKVYRRRLTLWYLGWYACLVLFIGILTVAVLAAGSERILIPRFAELLFLIVSFSAFVWFMWRSWYRTRLSTIIRSVETSRPDLHNCLSSAYYLSTRSSEIDRFGYSDALIENVDRRARSWIEKSSAQGPAFKPAHLRIMCVALILMVAISGLLFSNDGIRARFDLEWRRLWGTYTSFHADSEIIINAVDKVPSGESASITIKTSKNVYNPLIHWHFPGRPWKTENISASFTKEFEWERAKSYVADVTPAPPILRSRVSANPYDTGKNMYEYTTPPVTQTFLYRISAGDEISSTMAIEPLRSPEIVAATAEMHPPGYTGLTDQILTSPEGAFSLIYGATTRITWAADRRIKAATFISQTPLDKPLQVTPDGRLQLEFEALSDFVYQLELRDILGLNNISVAAQISPVPDNPPQAKITSPSPDLELPADMRIPLRLETNDDYGFSAVDLVYEISYTGETHRLAIWSAAGDPPPALPSVKDRTFAFVGNAQTHRSKCALTWDVVSLNLLPGETLNYWIEVWDNNAVDGPQYGRSAIHVIRSKSLYDQYQDDLEYDAALAAELDDLLNRQQEIGKQTRQILERVENKKLQIKSPNAEDSPYVEKERLEEVEEQQKDLKEDLEELAGEIEKNADEIIKQNTYSLNMLQKIEKIQELLDNLLTEDMKRIMNKFNEVLEQLSRKQEKKDLKDLGESLENFEKKLDRTLRTLQTAYFQKQLEALTRQLQEVTKEQERLHDETQEAAEEPASATTPSATFSRLSMKQEQLTKQTEAILDNLGELKEQMEEDFPKMSQKLDELGQKAQDQEITKTMQKATEALGQSLGKIAMADQKQAQEGLEELLAGLESSKNMMGGMSLQVDLAGLRSAYERTLQLSQAQGRVLPIIESLRGEAASTDLWKSHPLGREARWLETEAGRIASQVETLASKNPFIDYRIIELLYGTGEAQMNVVDTLTLGLIQNLTPLSHSSLAQTNEAAYLLLRNLALLMQQQKSMGLEGYFQQLEEMIRRQEKLNMDTQRLHEEPRDRPSWQEDLERIAKEQRQIREQLKKLEEMQKDLDQLLGRFDQLGQEMGEVEKMLEDQKTGFEVQEKQQEILTRLLDAEKSQKEQAYSRRRRSKPGEPSPEIPASIEEKEQVTRDQLIETQWDLERELLPLGYREKITTYFRQMSAQPF